MRKLEAYCGDKITRTIAKAISEAKKGGDEVGFDFNGVHVVVSGASDPALIYRDWSRGLSGYLGNSPTVGPYPKHELSSDEVANDSSIKEENDRKSRERQAEYDKKQAAQTTALQEALSVAGPLELSDSESWAKCVEANKDGYGGRCVRYAEEWGRLMQMRIANGETISACAEVRASVNDP